MKILLALCLSVAVSLPTLAWAADAPTPSAKASNVVSGEVLEVKDVDIYTYLRLKTRDGETWAAVSKAPVKVGAKVTIENPSVMKNFESKVLKKTFPTIVFGTLAGTGGKEFASAHANAPQAVTAATAPIKVPKASGANARTVAEVHTKSAELKDKPVVVAGQVVKFNPAIMGKNWVHLRDGSGDAAKETNDILVTTQAQAKVGDVVTVSGVVRTNKDFGAGYTYKVLIEDATLKP
ncbi:nucleotide-binding protein [Candidatus Skiveiella danica]|jgi:hypothetical protein|uniref:nucleotide-binding protein n=1 Tax=Candidatus Skiveiella danica TaxID=3386177 RepID=UPI0009D0E8F6|nr:nucleotide-binding protein [Burkholderiaceae bacterium]OQC09066.1 MAG: hypothetical protein BWX79_01518 [Alphaproteobacteria bacterium ADurb.Bin100]HPL79120.1 nucleotide-binding protein [Burkholderiaceae bacterium]